MNKHKLLKGIEALKKNIDDPLKLHALLGELQGSLVLESTDALPDIEKQVQDALDELDENMEHKGKKGRIVTHLSDLNRYLTMAPGDLIVIAAEPSVGKTTLALNFIEHHSMVEGKASAIFSIEMSYKQLLFRLMGSLAKVNVREMEQLNNMEDCQKLVTASTRIRKAPISIIDDPDLTPLEIRQKSRQLVQEKGVSLIVVDYLQIVTDEGVGDRNEAQSLSDKTMHFKRMAKELNCVVVLPSQIEEVTGKTYGSRAIKHHADSLVKIHPGEPYRIEIVKQRNGPRDKFVPVQFMSHWTRFENAAKEND